MEFDKLKLIPCPILYPNIDDFSNPTNYFSRADVLQLGNKYGIVKVVPPVGWQPPFLISLKFRFHTRLQRISDLGLSTRSREFFKKSINRFLKMRGKKQLRLYFRAGKREFGEKSLKRPKVYYYDLYLSVEKLGGSEAMGMNDWKELNKKFGVIPINSSDLEQEYNANLKGYALFLTSNSVSISEGAFHHSSAGVHENGLTEEDEVDGRRKRRAYDDGEENCVVCSLSNNPEETLLCDGCDRAYHMSCLEPKLPEIPKGSWFCDKCLIGTGAYGFEEQVNLKYSIPDFHEHCNEFARTFEEEYNDGKRLEVDEIEKKFWEFVDIEKLDLEVRYGADIHNMVPGEILGFPVGLSSGKGNVDNEKIDYYSSHPFNLTKLPFAGGSLMKFIESSISGMTIPWIYIGSLFLTFCWHVEDHYTLLINYCHMGATKKWYGIPASQADQFEKLMKDSAPDLFQRQPDLLHQLVTLLLPMTLYQNGIQCVYADQQPNEFIVTYPRVYHSGFNCGFNFNEAVNFVIEPWLDYGERAISDYREIKKENVFNHFRLEENILKEYVRNPNKFNPAFIEKAVKSLEKYHVNDMRIIKLNGEKVNVRRNYKDTSFNGGQTMSPILNPSEEEEVVCDDCKTYLGYHHYIVPNRDHQYSRLKFERHIYGESKKLEKQQSPEISTTTSVLATPKEDVVDKMIKREGDEDMVTKMQKSESGSRLALITDEDGNSAKLSKEQEFEELIDSARKQTSEEPSYKRRRSTRIQKQEISTVASIGRAKKFIPPINEKKELRLCVECCQLYSGIMPVGTQLVYERNPRDVADLVSEVKQILRV